MIVNDRAGQYDVLCILKFDDKYYPAIFIGNPMKNNDPQEIGDVELISDKHFTKGFEELKECQEFINKSPMKFDDENICIDPVDWDGELGIAWLLPNWRANNTTITEAMKS